MSDLFVCVKDTATTEIYTYGHTLALHDALPSSRRRSARPLPTSSPCSDPRRPRRRQEAGSARGRATRSIASCRTCPATRCVRSEEHTSELQSLMRNSYAVLCLKKKKIDSTSPYTILQHHDHRIIKLKKIN